MKLRVLLLGVGSVGEVIAKHLASENKVVLSVADVDQKRLLRIKRMLRAKKIRMYKVGDESVETIMENSDMIINAAKPSLNLELMKLCFKHRVNYMDLASYSVLRQLALDETWKRRGIFAIICMGEDPGLSNIYARYAADRLEKVHTIRIRDGEFSKSWKYPLVALFSPEVFFDEIISPSHVFVEGSYKRLPAFGGYELYEFPDPIGKRPVYSVEHEEIYTLPKFIGKGIGYVDFKLALDDEMVKTVKLLKRVGFLSRRKVRVRGQSVSPRDVLFALVPKPSEIAKHVEGYAGLVVEVDGESKGRKVSYRLYTLMSHGEAYRLFGVSATAYLTGTIPASVASLVANGQFEPRGVMVPEQLNPDQVLQHIAKKNIRSHIESSEQTLL